MSEIINGVPIGDLPGIESVPDDSMLVVEFLGKAYHMPGAVLRQMIQDVLDSMGDSVDDVTEARLTAAIETVLSSGKYNGVSPLVEVLDEEDGTSVIHIIDAFGVKKYPVEVNGARNAVQYVEQSLTDAQKAQARKNIGLDDATGSADNVYVDGLFSAKYADIKAAYEAGKACFITYGALLCTMTVFDEEKAEFVGMLTPHIGMKGILNADGSYSFAYVHSNAVQTVAQNLTDEQKAQVRANINAALDNIYFVKFSDAKYDEIKAAYDAGKLCFVQYANFVTCYMTRATDEYFMFDSAIGADAALRLQIGSDGTNTYEIIHSSAIMYTAQSLTLAQKEQARKNIGAADAASTSKAANAVIVELAGNHTDGYTALLDGEAAIGDTLNELAQAGNVVIGIASSEMTFWLSSGMVYRVPEGTIFRYGNAVVSHEYRSLGFEFYVQMEDNNLALFYQDDGWVGKAQPVHITFYLVPPDSEGKMIRYNGEMLAASDAYWLLFDSMYRSRPVFCYQENAVFYAEDDSKHKPDMYTPFYFNGTDFSFCCEQDGYAYTLLISTSGYTPTAKKTTPYKTAESKADDLKAEDGTLMLLSAGEPIGEGVPIPTGDSNVFVGNYDTVTFTEIKTAHDAGKVCFLDLDGLMLPLLYLSDTEAVFIREVNETTDYKVTVTSADGKDVTLVDKNTPIYVSQSLSDAQKAQARTNIGAMAESAAGTDGILPVRLRTYQDHNNAVSDPNLATETGFYYVNTATNRPPFSQSTNIDYRVLTTAYSDQWLQQIATDFRCGDMFLRRRENGTWTQWVRFATAGDLGGYLPLAGGTMTGDLVMNAPIVPLNNGSANLGADSRRFQAIYGKEYYFSDADSNFNSPYKFGMYQWQNNFTFVTRNAANSHLADAWQINGETAVTNFNKRPTVNGAQLALLSDISSGNANTSTMPLGFASRTTGATWGNTIGTSFTSWNDPTGGSIDFRQDNPSGGKMSIKVDGRVYINEGLNPVMGMEHTNDYWGMTSPDGERDVWIRTTTSGIIPFQNGAAGSGHCYLGTSTWYFGESYIDRMYGTNLTLAGRLYSNEWIQCNGDGGLFFPNYNGLHIMANTVSTYTPLRIVGEKTSYNGVLFGNDSTGLNVMSCEPHQGLYNESKGRWITYYKRDSDQIGIGTAGLSGSTITLGGSTNVQGILTQGSPSEDTSVALMNRFQSDLFVQGSGAAPNGPTVAGFYLGKSAFDENRHMDIVSGGDYSYIDFNKAGRAADYDARLMVNVTNGYTEFMWGSSGEITQRVLNIQGSLRKNGVEVATRNDVVEAANGSLKVTLSGNATDGYTVDKTLAQIETALNAGRHVYLVENDGPVYQLSMHIAGMMACFTSVVATSNTQVAVNTVVVYDGIAPSVFTKTL